MLEWMKRILWLGSMEILVSDYVGFSRFGFRCGDDCRFPIGEYSTFDFVETYV